ncbi:MAG TPA: NAD(P)/FAD-dependent oxidoreductase [Streptosporangiaceae bacterium]|nr:NAD(P)/FAD-dependent oxidoreductase [Streptosporangiaceae bacterium]
MEILIVGGGYIGMYTARRLERLLRRGEATVTVVDPRGYMTYQPFLAEAAGGSVEPRHVIAPLPRVLRRTRVLTGKIVSIDRAAHQAVFAPAQGPERILHYDVLVMAAGSVSRVLPVDGLAEYGAGFKTVGEAVHLRNHVLGQLAMAASTDDPAARAAALRFVVIGGGFAGVEALAELQGLADEAVRFHPALDRSELRWVLVEATGRILPELDERLGQWTLRALRRRGVDVRLHTRLASAARGTVLLDDGTELAAGTLVWAAGVRPSPLGASAGLPADKSGRIQVGADLAVTGVPGVFAAGDIAAVPDLTRPGEFCAPNAQHAVRQTKTLARNIIAFIRGGQLKPYKHAYLGSVAGLGHHQGVAQVYQIRLTGFAGWLAHRVYHLFWVPTLSHKARVLADWTLALFFRRETAQLTSLEHPEDDFHEALRAA